MGNKPTEKQSGIVSNAERYKTVVKANELIQKTRFSLSTQQQKMILYLISQIDKYDEEFKMYEFKIAEFCRICGIEAKGDNYNSLKEQIKKISDKSLWITLENGEDALVRWIENPHMSKKSGIIKIRLNEDMKPYLLHLKEKFTEYELIYTLMFKSRYSIRLYEYLKSIHYNKLKSYQTTIDINEFQKLIDSPYNNFKDFHTRVLKPAFKEINEYSDILFNYELVAKGRKTTHIIIKIETKEVMSRIRTSLHNELLLDKRKGEVSDE